MADAKSREVQLMVDLYRANQNVTVENRMANEKAARIREILEFCEVDP